VSNMICSKRWLEEHTIEGGRLHCREEGDRSGNNARHKEGERGNARTSTRVERHALRGAKKGGRVCGT